jgi:hypothetical protein
MITDGEDTRSCRLFRLAVSYDSKIYRPSSSIQNALKGLEEMIMVAILMGRGCAEKCLHSPKQVV